MRSFVYLTTVFYEYIRKFVRRLICASAKNVTATCSLLTWAHVCASLCRCLRQQLICTEERCEKSLVFWVYNAVESSESQPAFRRTCCHHLYASFLLGLILQHWIWRRNFSLKRWRNLNWLNGVVSQKTEFFIVPTENLKPQTVKL
jgi:hypothetical protein